MSDLTITPVEIAEAIGKSRSWVYERLRRNDCPFPVRYWAGQIIVPRAAFLAWLEGE